MSKEISSTGIETIIKTISDTVNKSLEVHESDYDIDPYDVENLVECKDLCNKILNYDYFSISESYISYLSEVNRLKKFSCFNKVLDKWYSLYKKDLKEKRKDLKKLFKLVIDLSEEI